MSQLQTAEHTTLRHDVNERAIHGVAIDETNSDANRRALYESFRQRDAWLRKPWGRARHIEVDFQ